MKGDYAMFKIKFYRDKKGREPVRDYIVSLKTKNTKDSLVKLHKIQDYINLLSENGTQIGMPIVRHLEGDIWELRPMKDRILFFTFEGEYIVFLSHFRKMTQKTPKMEIKKADKCRKDFIERSKEYE